MTPGLDGQTTSVPIHGFFARQFAVDTTKAQDFFDGLFGVFLPVLCFLADPLVFRENGGSLGIYSKYQLLAYTFSAIQIATLLTWRTFSRRLTWMAAPIGGVFLAGSLFSTVIGVFILPFSLIGMFMLIGFAGFIPFVTAFVYLRTGIRALKAHHTTRFVNSPITLTIPAAILAIALPLIVSNNVSSLVSISVTEVLYGDKQTAEVAVSRLKRMPFLSEREMRRMVVAYHNELDPEKREALSQHYKEVTGRAIEFRSRTMD
jgi:hypothetical protein